MSTSAFVTVQVFVLGGSLVVAAGSKVRVTETARGRTLLAAWWREVYSDASTARRRRGLETLWWSLIALEAVLGVAVLVPPTRMPSLVAASVFLAGAIVFSCWGLRAAHDATCGCFGAAARNTPWTVVRSSWLFASAVTCLAAGSTVAWHRASASEYAVVAVIDAVVLGVSSEAVRGAVARAVATARQTSVHRVRDATVRKEAVHAIAETGYWRNLVESGIVRDREPTRIWRQGDWVMMDFSGTYDGSEVSVVGGMRIGFQPPWCRVVLVDPTSDPPSVRASWDSLTQATAGAAEAPTERRQAQAAGVR